ncbi:MAG: ABC transporter permease [Anaerolineae bacterium]|nr:ABC transporter permease [Anaerolineae bacterium]
MSTHQMAKLPSRSRFDAVAFGMGIIQNRIVSRLLRSLLVGFGVMTIAFFLLRLVPGDPVQLLLGDTGTPELVEAYRQMLGLDGTLPEQYLRYLGSVMQGDLGTSINSSVSVNTIIARSLPVTLWLIAVTIVLALALALPLSIAAAIYQRTWFGHTFRVASSILLATPVFYSGLLLLLLFAIQLKVAPVAGYRTTFPTNLNYLWLPALVLCGVMVPITARVLQSSVIDTLDQEFVETAVVRGLGRLTFTWRYLLRPSLAPTISLLGYMIGQLLSAAVVVELVFNLPGIGTSLIVEGVLLRDYPVVQGIVLVFGMIVVIVSFLSDLVSGWLDPRTQT